MREILTLQLGELGNYIGNHFWNTQESYFTYDPNTISPINHDIHWRQGLGADGSETYLPRTVIYDFKASLGSLKQISSLYEPVDESGAAASSTNAAIATASGMWRGKPEIHRADQVTPSEFQQALNAGLAPVRPAVSDVRFWSDTTRVYFHPRSLVSLDNPNMTAPSTSPSPWARGSDLFESLDREHDLLDRDFRAFLEEADCLQAVQIFGSIDDIWAPFAAGFIERLRDDLGKASIVTWAAGTPVAHSMDTPRATRNLHTETRARTIVELWDAVDLLVPLAMPQKIPKSGYGWDSSAFWHVGGVLGTAVESALLVTRTMRGTDVSEMSSVLSARGKQTIAHARMSVTKASPIRIEEADKEKNRNNNNNNNKKKKKKKRDPRDIDRDAKEEDQEKHDEEDELEMDLELLDLLGPARPHLRGPKPSRKIFTSLLTRRGLGREDIAPVSRGLVTVPEPQEREYIGRRINRRYDIHLGFPILDSFPEVYFKGHSGGQQADVDVVLETDDGVCKEIGLLRRTVTGIVRGEDREGLGNSLADIVEEYHDGWSSGSDEDDD